MITLEAAIEIAAPIERVWQILLDFPSYGAWNPFVVRIDGEARVGGRLVLEVRRPGGRGGRYGEIVTELAPPAGGRATLSWRFAGLIDRIGAVSALRVQSLEGDATRTRYVTREQLHGWLAWVVPRAQLQAGFDAHVRALQARAETLR